MIYLILVVHYICDFLLQPREVAIKKGKSIVALINHISTYGIFFFIFCSILFSFENIYNIFAFSMVNTLVHGVVDFFTSKWTGYLYSKDKYKQYFDVIGFDQLIHVVTLLLTYNYFLL